MYSDNLKSEQEQFKLKVKYDKAIKKFGSDPKRKLKLDKEYAKDSDKIKKRSLDNELKGYGDLASSAKSLFDEKTGAYKAMEAIETAMHVARLAQMAMELPAILANTVAKWGEAGANATASVTAAGTGDPYTAPARVALMIGLMAGAMTMFGGSGGSGGGGSDGVAPTNEQGQTADIYDSQTNLITSRLDRQIALLESIDKQGTANVYKSDLAKAIYERTVGALTFEAGSIRGDAGNVEQYIKDTFASMVTGFEDISNIDIGEVRGGGGVSFDTSGLIGNLTETMRFIQFMDEGWKSGDFNFQGREIFEQMTPEGITELMNSAQQAISEYAISMIDIVGDMGDAKDTFKDIFDDLTNTTTYADAELKKAFADFDKLVGDRSYADYLVEQIDNIQKVQDSLTENDIALLLSQNFDDALKQAEVIDRLRAETGLALKNGAKDALNYIESIELVAEAMIKSNDNFDEWQQRNEDTESTAKRLADAIGVDLAESMSELDNLAKMFIISDGLLTDAELELLQANEDYLESIGEVVSATDAFSDSLSNLESELKSIQSTRDRVAERTRVLSGDRYGADDITAAIFGLNNLSAGEQSNQVNLLGKMMGEFSQDQINILKDQYNAMKESNKIAISSAKEAAQAQNNSIKAWNSISNDIEGLKDFALNFRISQSPELAGGAFNETLQQLERAIDVQDAELVGSLSSEAKSFASLFLGTLSSSQLAAEDRHSANKVLSSLEALPKLEEKTLVDVDASVKAVATEIGSFEEVFANDLLGLKEEQIKWYSAIDESLGTTEQNIVAELQKTNDAIAELKNEVVKVTRNTGITATNTETPLLEVSS